MNKRAMVALLTVVPIVSPLVWTGVGAQDALTPVSSSTVTEKFAASAIRIEVSIDNRTLWVVSGVDTLRTAPIAVASGLSLEFGKQRWTFETPRGSHVVLGKRPDPVWRPPDWHYVEAANELGVTLKPLPSHGATLNDGRRVVVRQERVGLIMLGDTAFLPLPADEHIVFNSTMYIPPFGTRNRQIRGELGRYALDIGDGYLIHGTPDQGTVGDAVTHGCLRLLDADIEWVYKNVPVGAKVVIR